MHIAICDDNIADRKQLERLLSRESDKRIQTSGVLYIDSYGHETTLLRAPMVYDLFFIDMTEENHTGLDVAMRLRDFGVTAPIVMCSAVIDYTLVSHTLSDIIHIKKPIQPETLSELLTEIIPKTQVKKPTVEIRDEENTYYLFPEDILCAHEEAHMVIVTLKDGSTRRMLGNIYSLCASLESFAEFFITKKKYVINTIHLTSISFQELVLHNSVHIPLSFGENIILKKYMNEQKRKIT